MTTRQFCRCCGRPLSDESIEQGKCVHCKAYFDRFIALAMKELEERREADYETWWRDNHPAMPDVDARREMYYQAGQYPPKPVM